VVDGVAAVSSAVHDSLVDAVSHLLHVQLSLFILVDGVVVDVLALGTQLLAKRVPQSRHRLATLIISSILFAKKQR